MADTKLPSFRPQCDRAGGYMPKQCWQEVCWCVDASGKEIPETVGNPTCANGSLRAAQGIMSVHNKSGLLTFLILIPWIYKPKFFPEFPETHILWVVFCIAFAGPGLVLQPLMDQPKGE